jgi:hypothetical protein
MTNYGAKELIVELHNRGIITNAHSWGHIAFTRFPDPTAEEMFKILPEELLNGATLKITKKGVSYFNETIKWYHVVSMLNGTSLALAIAKMLIWLDDNNLLVKGGN